MPIKFFDWYGGKIRMLSEILALLPNKIHTFMELFGGSLAVTLNHVRCEREYVNDFNPHIARLHRLMCDRKNGKVLLDRLLQLSVSEADFISARRAYKTGFRTVSDEFRKAELTYILISQSFNSAMYDFRKGMTPWKYEHSLWKNLPEVYKRLDGVISWNRNALQILQSFHSDNSVFALLDPPYRQELRGAKQVYTCEMPMTAQLDLLNIIKDSKNSIMLCGYRSQNGNDLYDKILLPHGWKHYKLRDIAKASQTKSVKDIATEWVWLNYEPPMTARYNIEMSSVNW